MRPWGKRVHLLSRSLLSKVCASLRAGPGLQFDTFGRLLGVRLLRAGDRRLGWRLLVNPVSIFRYWEFDYASQQLPTGFRNALDISSPRLFTFWATTHNPQASIEIWNPDHADATTTQSIQQRLAFGQVASKNQGVHKLSEESTYDVIWSLSVVEHISGEYDDAFAVRRMFDALKPGGSLILTVPVDRHHRDEYREENLYGTAAEKRSVEYFFQRVYDRSTLYARLIHHLESPQVTVRWFGEKSPGHYVKYRERWMKYGLRYTVRDPCEIATNFREYHSWQEMPGMGVCGITIIRPHGTRESRPLRPGQSDETPTRTA